jgi:glycosyltransferase involved in cell wall biosynthesis
MKIYHINFSDNLGGAARAAYRLHQCLRDNSFDSMMWVNKANLGDWTVEAPITNSDKLRALIRPHLIKPIFKTFHTDNPIIHSVSLLPSRWLKAINESDADVVHLHWVQNEMLSISDIGRIKKPVVWTLHDMWAFCGAEHLSWDDRWSEGYKSDNRPQHESGFDLNRWTWQRKLKHWAKPRHIVTPSRWMGACVAQSALMKNWPVSVIPNPIDLSVWKPVDQQQARTLLGLPLDTPVLLFGSFASNDAQHKGFDLLKAALEHLSTQQLLPGLQLLVFGQTEPKNPPKLGFPIHYLGHLHDDVSLRLMYSAADALLIPSRQDNLPNTGVEALACGTPVIAFDTCGLPDIVEHLKTGYLAQPFDPKSLADGIVWVIENAVSAELRKHAAARAVSKFSFEVVSKQYTSVYQEAMNQYQHTT